MRMRNFLASLAIFSSQCLHLRTILADIEKHRSSYLMHMGGNDLGSRGNAIDNVVIGLTALLTQIRVKFHIPHIHA